MGIQHATDDTFEQLVLKNDKPVVVDFWATWCGPCKMVAPEMEKIAAKYEGAIDRAVVEDGRRKRYPVRPARRRARVGRPERRTGNQPVEAELGTVALEGRERDPSDRPAPAHAAIFGFDARQVFRCRDQHVEQRQVARGFVRHPIPAASRMAVRSVAWSS